MDRRFLLAVCLTCSLLFFQPGKASGLNSIHLALRWDKGLLPFVRYTRILEAVAVETLHMNPSLAPAPSVMLDPNQSDKRRVRRGSDPIHNKC